MRNLVPYYYSVAITIRNDWTFTGPLVSKKRTKVFPPRLFEKMLVSGSRSFGGGGDLHVSSLNSQYLFILKLNLTVLKTQKLKLFLPLILRRFFAFIVFQKMRNCLELCASGGSEQITMFDCRFILSEILFFNRFSF